MAANERRSCTIFWFGALRGSGGVAVLEVLPLFGGALAAFGQGLSMPIPVPSPDELARMMRGLRWLRELSTDETADLLGISRRTVEGIEQGRGFNAPAVLALAIEALVIREKIHQKPNLSLDDIR